MYWYYPSENKDFYLPQAFGIVIKFHLLSPISPLAGCLAGIDSIRLQVSPAKTIIYATHMLTKRVFTVSSRTLNDDIYSFFVWFGFCTQI